jgi:hypothetical protein
VDRTGDKPGQPHSFRDWELVIFLTPSQHGQIHGGNEVGSEFSGFSPGQALCSSHGI